MGASSVAGDVAVGFEWTPFSHGFAFWEYPGPEHLPPPAEAGQREWLEGFLQAHADCPNEPYDPDNPDSGETAADALRRMLAGNPQLPALLALLELDHERDEIDTERPTDRLQLDDINPAVAAFGLADERAFDAKPPGQLFLR